MEVYTVKYKKDIQIHIDIQKYIYRCIDVPIYIDGPIYIHT